MSDHPAAIEHTPRRPARPPLRRGRRAGALRLVAALCAVAAAAVVAVPASAQNADDKAVGALTLSSDAPGTLTVSWDAPASAPSDYRVRWESSTDSADRGNAYPTGSSHTITGLEHGAAYQVRVRARYSGDRPGPWSAAVTAVVASEPDDGPSGQSDGGGDDPPQSAPGRPTGLTAATTAEDVTLAWDDPGDDSIQRYLIYRKKIHAFAAPKFIVIGTVGPTDFSYVDVTVTSGDTAIYRVQAENAAGKSTWSTFARVVVPDPPPLPPLRLIEPKNEPRFAFNTTPPAIVGEVADFTFTVGSTAAEGSVERIVSNLSVGNSGDHESLGTADSRHVQGFTAGDVDTVLTSVTIRASSVGNAGLGGVRVSIRPQDGTGPADSDLVVLETPAVRNRRNVNLDFEAASGKPVVLSAGATYYVVVAGTSALELSFTSSNSQDAGGESGWSIADERSDSHSNRSFVLRFAVNGYESDNHSVHSDFDAVRGWGRSQSAKFRDGTVPDGRPKVTAYGSVGSGVEPGIPSHQYRPPVAINQLQDRYIWVGNNRRIRINAVDTRTLEFWTSDVNFHEIFYSDSGIFNGAEWGPLLGREPPPGPQTTVAISRRGSTSVRATPATLVFNEHNWDTAQQVRVSAFNNDDSADNRARITHRATGGGYDLTQTVQVTTIDQGKFDFEPPCGVQFEVTHLGVAEDGPQSEYRIWISHQPGPSEQVTVTVRRSGDLRIPTQQFTFHNSSWQRSQAETVVVRADADADTANDTATITHTVTGPTIDGCDFNSERTLPVTVFDSDVPNLVVTALAVTPLEPTTDSFGPAVVYEVFLTEPPVDDGEVVHGRPVFAVVPSRGFSAWKWNEYLRMKVTFPAHPGEEHWFDLQQACEHGYQPPRFSGRGVELDYPHDVNLPGATKHTVGAWHDVHMPGGWSVDTTGDEANLRNVFRNHYESTMCWHDPGFAAGRFDAGERVRIQIYADYTDYGTERD